MMNTKTKLPDNTTSPLGGFNKKLHGFTEINTVRLTGAGVSLLLLGLLLFILTVFGKTDFEVYRTLGLMGIGIVFLALGLHGLLYNPDGRKKARQTI